MTDQTLSYHVLLVDGVRRRVSTLRGTREVDLAELRISRRRRPAPEIQTMLRRDYGLSSYLIDICSGDAGHPAVAIAEMLRTAPTSQPLVAVHLEELAELLSPEQRKRARSIIACDSKTPIFCLGWIRDAIGWVESAVRSRLLSDDAIEQFNAGNGFTLLRLTMIDGCSYWLKAAASPNHHEMPITNLLGQLSSAQQHLPRIVAVKPEWDAWLMAEDAVTRPASSSDLHDNFERLRKAVVALARIQVASLGREDELISCGAFDQRLHALERDLPALFAAVEALLRLSLDRCCGNSLDDTFRVVHAALKRIPKINLPDTILHGDLNWGNLLFSECCQLIDWSEAYVGNPLISLWHLMMLHSGDDVVYREALDKQLLEEYCEVWQGAPYEIDSLIAAFDYAPCLAAVSTLYGRGTWFKSTAYPYAPAVSRIVPHLQREARTLRERGLA